MREGLGPGPHGVRPVLGRAPSCPSQAGQAPLMMDEREEDADEEAWLQLRPVEPLPSQCCGSGCSPCVFDLYHRELARWEAARASKDRSLLSGEESQSCPSKLSPETFLAFCISAVDRLTEDTYHVRFALPRNCQFSLRPGQHLILRGKVDGLEIQRAYTPISPANAEGYFEVLIKRVRVPVRSPCVCSQCYPTGLMSRYVKSWGTGHTAFWRGPFGDFFYKANQENSLEKLPWSYREKTRFGRLAQGLIEELVGSCRRKPFALVCGSAEFTKDMARCLLCAGLAKDSYFLF
ncbi:NADH-cytochrome b5 reductase-like isoform X4 [Mirounga angustirostris]|uniref:NADH-cytochrome b5 reductase-like isoform X4 n=1 Tax=Mirounga angustirostris TaxID=9716 RepID=UPI001E688CA0|nr:NADH-cytochrome b5 reductase-like isoform X4 [Mirounga angustirostris]